MIKFKMQEQYLNNAQNKVYNTEIQFISFNIYNGSYGKITNKNKYFTFAAYVFDKNNEQIFYRLGDTRSLAPLLEIDYQELHDKFIQYNAMANIDGGNLFTSLDDAQNFFVNVIEPRLIALKLSEKILILPPIEQRKILMRNT